MTLGAAGAAILDVADAAEPELVTVYGADPNSWAQGVEVSDSLAYVAGLPPLRIFDVSNPAAPVQLNAGDEFAESYSFWDIALSGDVAVVSDCYVGCDVATVSIANPAAPFMLDTMSQPHTYVARVGVAGAYAFGADWGWGLRVFDMTDPADLRDIDGRGWSCRDVSSDGAYLYASADQGLQVYGLPNPPATLILLGEYAAGAESRQLALDGDGFVGLADLSALLEHFGTNAGAAHRDGDLDGDGDVDQSDLGILLGDFGCN